MPIKPTQLAAGLPAKPPCPVTTPPVATESENESRLTENALATLQSQNISDATNTHSAPMSVSDATEPVDSPARNVPSDTSKMGRIHEVTSTPVVTGSLPLNQPHRAAEPAPSSAVSPMTAKLPPLSQQRKDNIAPPISAVTPVTIGGRSASLPVTHPHVPKLNARRPDQTDNFTSPKYKIPSSLPNELTQESEITETCRALSYLFQLRANESERRDADEKATATQQRNLQQQIDDLKRSQKALEELVTTQTKRIEELIALGEEKDRRNAELETFKRGVVDLVETQPYKRASTKESSTG
ncbi:hypothetical protein BJY00DRAFT_32981 [Aspergillus carlsbadensis]|nr:hypothetical protein BJY00DRAFT_32981 [Aspergillus carlsbadensis]